MTETLESTHDKCHHCHGTGFEPEPRKVTAKQAGILEKLREAGERRKKYSAKRTIPELVERDKAYADIRKLAAQAEGSGLLRDQVAEAVGLTRGGLHNILAKNVTG